VGLITGLCEEIIEEGKKRLLRRGKKRLLYSQASQPISQL
jgi:hypothetical protein